VRVPVDPNRRPAHLQLLAISWNFGWPVAAGVIAGYWIDDKLGSSPWVTLALGLGAMSAAVARLVRLSNDEARERREQERQQAEEARRLRDEEPARRPDPAPAASEEEDEDAELERMLAEIRDIEGDSGLGDEDESRTHDRRREDDEPR
jgi:F0F1-type ATP synthase assembly protein I